MSNIFKLTDDFKTIVDMADQLDDQTLEDMLEAIGELTADKVANTIAVIKSVKGELDVAKDFKKDLEGRIKSMNNTINRLTEYVQLGVETVGTPKKDAPDFKKLEIKNAPWVKSVWTQNNPPSVEIVNVRDIPEEFMIPKPSEPSGSKIAAAWKENMIQYEALRTAEYIRLKEKVDAGEMDPMDAEDQMDIWERENKHNYEIPGVEVKQSVGVRFR
jgi:Siphovirus Gp157